MIKKVSRLALITITIFVTAIILPEFYKTSFKRNTKYQTLNYSEVIEDFLIVGSAKEPIYDTKGNSYSVDEYQELIPLSSFMILMNKGLMPDSLKGVSMNFDSLASNSYDYRIQLRNYERYYGLIPLAQGSSVDYGNKQGNDFMRVNNTGINFVDATSNKVNVEKSNLFHNSLKELSYAPPAKKLWGSVLAGSENYNGVFFSDSKDNLFQVKYFDGEPICYKIELPEKMEIKKVYNFMRDGYIACLFNNQDQIFLLDENRKLLMLPIEGFNYDSSFLVEISGNLLYNFLSFKNEGYEKMVVMDKNFSFLDSYELNTEVYSQTKAGKVESFLYPFKIETYTYKNGFSFEPVFSYTWNFLLLNLLLAFFVYYYKNTRGAKTTNSFNIINITLVLIFGIYAFVGMAIFSTND